MKHPKLVVSRVTFDTDAIAKALRIKAEDVIKAFRDGRGAWPFSEVWGESLHGFIKHNNTNYPLSDGAVALSQLGDFRISVKALTGNGVKFQQSKDVGAGRTSTVDGLIRSLEACDRVIVVDLVEFPLVVFIPIDTTRLIGAVNRKELGVSGWKRDRLYQWLDATYDWKWLDLAI